MRYISGKSVHFVERLMLDFPLQATAREQFRELWRRLVASSGAAQAALFLELHHHASYLDAESKALEEAAFAPVVAFIRQAQAQEALKPLEPMVLIALVYGAFTGLAKTALAGHLTLDAETLEAAESCLWEAVRL